MSNIGIILGILITANIIMSIFVQNWCAVGGWLVAGTEWLRRLC